MLANNFSAIFELIKFMCFGSKHPHEEFSTRARPAASSTRTRPQMRVPAPRAG